MNVRLLAAVAATAVLAACTAPAAGPADTAAAAPAAAADAAARWFAHVEYLADDDMRGRETGSPEHRKAADYVADQFARAGLEPAGIAGFMQPVTFRSRKIVEEKSVPERLQKAFAHAGLSAAEQARFQAQVPATDIASR